MRKSVGLYVALLVLLLVGSGLFFYFCIPNNSVVPAFEEDRLNLVIEGQVIDKQETVQIVDNEILISFDIIEEFFDPNIYWDKEAKKVTVTTKDRVVRMRTESLQAMVNNKPVDLRFPVIVQNDVVYIPIEFLSDFYNLEINHVKESNVVIIDFNNKSQIIAVPLGKKLSVRKGSSIRYPVIENIDVNNTDKEAQTLRVFDEHDKWYKVRTSKGLVGYVEKKKLNTSTIEAKNPSPIEAKKDIWKPEKGKISISWEMMYEGIKSTANLKKIDGTDVVIPTWFQVANDKGDLINRAVPRYVEWAHKNGYKVWAMLSNDFKDTKMTHRLLNSTDAREQLIRQILAFSALYKLDGINIDFENINIEDKGALTQFVREITPLLREQGLVVSMCVSPMDGSANWSLCYDRKSIGETVDYVMLMAYDQNWPSMGPNAELKWVEGALNKVLNLVPNEKLILGLPFYTRLWKVETGKEGTNKASYVKSLTIEAALKTVKENNATVKWVDEMGQFYAEYKSEEALYKLWIEEKNSINMKSSLIHKYNLPGGAVWSGYFGEETTWAALNTSLKEVENYDQWKRKNATARFALD